MTIVRLVWVKVEGGHDAMIGSRVVGSVRKVFIIGKGKKWRASSCVAQMDPNDLGVADFAKWKVFSAIDEWLRDTKLGRLSL